mmetsp:Transcript_39092/g.80065  ORF Transcript_39092/g.80065 Transcript_39092/m.80065 type:complete len:121 (+) Transcript_39092:2160-2522(+)
MADTSGSSSVAMVAVRCWDGVSLAAASTDQQSEREGNADGIREDADLQIADFEKGEGQDRDQATSIILIPPSMFGPARVPVRCSASALLFRRCVGHELAMSHRPPAVRIGEHIATSLERE